MPDLLVTGTDTGVGKTVIAAAIVLALRERGARALGWKPAESGVTPPAESDSDVLAKASGVPRNLAPPLLRLAEPLAPAVAAERAGVAVQPAAFEARVRELRALGFSLVIEGAGGLLAPLAWGYTAADLAERLGLEAVVVARPGLGTLNHVILTLEALNVRGIRVRGVVLNARSAHPDLAEETNPEALRRLRPGLRVLVVPSHDTKDPLVAAYASVPLVVSLL